MIAAVVSVVAVNACGDGKAAQCPAVAGNAGADVQIEVAPGLYAVTVEMEGARVAVDWAWRMEAAEGLVQEGRAALGDGRWLRVSTRGEAINVTECWRGGTADGGCAELGPPRSGTLVLTRDGGEVARLALFAPVEETVAEAGCPTLHHGRVR